MKWFAFGRAVLHLLSGARRTRSRSAQCQQRRILTYLAAAGYRPFAAVVLLVDSPQPVQLAAELGAVASLPLLFTLHDLVTAVQQGASARIEGAQAANAVGHRI